MPWDQQSGKRTSEGRCFRAGPESRIQVERIIMGFPSSAFKLIPCRATPPTVNVN